MKSYGVGIERPKLRQASRMLRGPATFSSLHSGTSKKALTAVGDAPAGFDVKLAKSARDEETGGTDSTPVMPKVAGWCVTAVERKTLIGKSPRLSSRSNRTEGALRYLV
jgi:hypothetical protein